MKRRGRSSPNEWISPKIFVGCFRAGHRRNSIIGKELFSSSAVNGDKRLAVDSSGNAAKTSTSETRPWNKKSGFKWFNGRVSWSAHAVLNEAKSWLWRFSRRHLTHGLPRCRFVVTKECSKRDKYLWRGRTVRLSWVQCGVSLECWPMQIWTAVWGFGLQVPQQR